MTLKTAIKISNKTIAADHPPYIIAEAGSNFNQSMDTAKQLIDVAATAGADAVKFQLFQANQLYPNGGELYDIFKSIELDSGWVPDLQKHAHDQGIEFLASAFDRKSVDALEAANVPAYKVASSETTNLSLLHYMAAKQKPMIIATGMCDMIDVEEAVNICAAAGNEDVALLQCGAMYPLPQELVNLRVMHAFQDRFGCPVGFSDHTLGISAATAAAALGACVIEKHFTLDRSSEGPDHFYALEPNELKAFVRSVGEAQQALGSPIKALLPDERKLGRRDGLYAARNIAAGEVIKETDITVRRPAPGIRARYLSAVSGATAKCAITKDEPLVWEQINL